LGLPGSTTPPMSSANQDGSPYPPGSRNALTEVGRAILRGTRPWPVVAATSSLRRGGSCRYLSLMSGALTTRVLSKQREAERVSSRSASSFLVGRGDVRVRLAAASVDDGGEAGFRGRLNLDDPAVLDDQRHRAVAQRAEDAPNIPENAIGVGGDDRSNRIRVRHQQTGQRQRPPCAPRWRRQSDSPPMRGRSSSRARQLRMPKP